MGSETVSMRIKSYFANTVEEAIHEARAELGGDATLITPRRTAAESRHLGAYEVVFGTTPASETQHPTQAAEELNAELSMLREQLDSIKHLLRLGAAGTGQISPRTEGVALYEQLVAAGIEESWARRIAEEVSAQFQSLSPAERSSTLLSEYAAETIANRLRYAVPPPADSNRTMIFIGPPGAGKTTTLTKIAIQECLARRLSLRLISVDLHSVAAHEKLRSYAAIIGAGFTAANTAQEFLEAVDEFRNKNVLLIDTPGYGARDWEWARDLAGVLSQIRHKEIHLVLSASMKPVDLLNHVHRFAEFNFEYLLFTKLDETTSPGSIVSAALEAEKPVSYLTRGQSIPEDLEPASASALTSGLFQVERAKAITAA